MVRCISKDLRPGCPHKGRNPGESSISSNSLIRKALRTPRTKGSANIPVLSDLPTITLLRGGGTHSSRFGVPQSRGDPQDAKQNGLRSKPEAALERKPNA